MMRAVAAWVLLAQGTAVGTPLAPYQVGDTWGRAPLQGDALLQDPVLRRAAYAVAAFGSATAFYLGRFAGRHVMATNAHVQPGPACRAPYVTFTVGDARLPCDEVLLTLFEIDLALFTVQGSDVADAYLAGLAHPFAWHAPVRRAQPLTTLGHGVGGNLHGSLTGGGDADCVAHSTPTQTRFLHDRDRINPADYQVWSMAHGCDISHGDSGSPLLDRASGDVLGIVWTGAIPVAPAATRSHYLRGLLESPDAAVTWHDLMYAVPAHKIYDILRRHLQAGDFSGSAATIVAAMLDPG